MIAGVTKVNVVANAFPGQIAAPPLSRLAASEADGKKKANRIHAGKPCARDYFSTFGPEIDSSISSLSAAESTHIFQQKRSVVAPSQPVVEKTIVPSANPPTSPKRLKLDHPLKDILDHLPELASEPTPLSEDFVKELQEEGIDLEFILDLTKTKSLDELLKENIHFIRSLNQFDISDEEFKMGNDEHELIE
jgi:hypothetical protein